MALRLDKAVVRGEVDNTRRGRVIGRLWLVDREEAIELALRGNAWREVGPKSGRPYSIPTRFSPFSILLDLLKTGGRLTGRK